MSAFTEEQRHQVRFFAGWAEGFSNLWVQLEGSMNNIEANRPGAFARITNAVNGTPPGILAQLEQVRADIFAGRRYLKAGKVGSIEVNLGNISQLRNLGAQFASELCQILGVAKERDVFQPGHDQVDAREGKPWIGGGGNYVGK
jgi:hypothetical protein